MSGTERPEQEPKEHDTKLDRDARFIAPAPCGQKVLGGQEGLRQANRLGQESREGMDQGMDAAAILRRWQLPLCRPTGAIISSGGVATRAKFKTVFVKDG
jgi:hypothetical protein